MRTKVTDFSLLPEDGNLRLGMGGDAGRSDCESLARQPGRQEWPLSLRDAIRQHPEMRGSVSTAEQITLEDPQFIFFILTFDVSLPMSQDFERVVGVLPAETCRRPPTDCVCPARSAEPPFGA